MHLTGYDPDFFFWQSLLLQARDEFTATFSKSGQQIKFSLYCSTTLLIFCSTPDDIHVEFVVAKHISSLAAVIMETGSSGEPSGSKIKMEQIMERCFVPCIVKCSLREDIQPAPQMEARIQKRNCK